MSKKQERESEREREKEGNCEHNIKHLLSFPYTHTPSSFNDVCDPFTRRSIIFLKNLTKFDRKSLD